MFVPFVKCFIFTGFIFCSQDNEMDNFEDLKEEDQRTVKGLISGQLDFRTVAGVHRVKT